MSTSKITPQSEQEFDLNISSCTELITDNPLEYFKLKFPSHPTPEKQIRLWKMMILSNCVKNVDDRDIEELLESSPISKSELDIMLLGLIDADDEYLRATKQLFEESRQCVTERPEQLTDDQLYTAKAIRW
jgi:hypothetical protein